MAGNAEQSFREAERRLLEAHGVVARERTFALERPKMRVRLLEIGEGEATLHVHGGGCFGALFAPLAAAMPGRRHLLLDRPGFGLSERVDLGPDYRAHSIEFLASTLDALGEARVDIVANSIGAGQALWLAVARPDRVRSLALVGAPAMIGNGAPLPLRLLATPVIGSLMMKLEPPSEVQVRRFFQRFGHDTSAVDPTVPAAMLAAERLPDYAHAWKDLLAATCDFRGSRPGLELSREELASIRCPVAFAWGAKDPTCDMRFGRAAAALIPDARFAITGVGHAPWLDDPEGVARAIEPVLSPAHCSAA